MRSFWVASSWRSDLKESNPPLARFVLRLAPRLGPLTRIPVLGRLLHWLGAKAMPRESRIWVRVKSGHGAGLWLRVNPRTGRPIAEGSGEPEVQCALAKHLRPGMVFYDLGANIGFFTLIGARLVGEKGRVFSFEADPEVCNRLRENVTRNNLSWVSVEQKAIWSKSGPLQFRRANPSESPDRGVGFVVNGPDPAAIVVEGLSLDECLRTMPAPDFIKCDVEGGEVEMIRGAGELLSAKRPIMMCEVHNQQNRTILLAEFSSFGYECRPSDENHILALPR